MTKDSRGADAAPDSEAAAIWQSRPPSSPMYEAILEVAADAIVTVNAAQEIVHFNRGAENIFGYRKDEVLGSSLDRLLPPQYRASHHGYIAAFGESTEASRLMGHRREVFGLRKDGTQFPAEASILKLDAPDGRRLYTAVVRDVTERKRMDHQQRFLAEVSATLSGSLDYEATLASVVRLPIPSLADACMLEVVDELGELHRLSHGDSGLLAAGATAIAERDELTLVARGQAMGVLTLLRSGSSRGKDPSDVLIAENFAARAALAMDNARLYHAAQRATAARDDILSVVSHDLRNPLCAIAMCSRVLVDTPPADPDARRALARTIHESTTWMSRMIQDLLDVAAIEAGVLSLVLASESIGHILTRSAALFRGMAEEKKLTMELNVSDDLPAMSVDAERLIQSVANLVGNAVKFTPSGGRVTIDAKLDADAVEIAVSDTGRGIAEADVPFIFDRFWRARGSAAGTGLGLAIAKGIVEAHHGTIVVRSRSGAGSRFSIRLPWGRPSAAL